ncbi:MAG: hypothetical protein KF696_04620 [Planctomycetes bacterium]|nr:hypothetical protein [Planctomycetota bacterium]MCW8134257.1 hypothetical protein [Planctomycetota bacterium]
MPGPAEQRKLRIVKALHTAIWAFFVACIFMIHLAALMQWYAVALVFVGVVLIEVLILVVNGMRCPLTDVAGRYTQHREANFDIYLPRWLAQNNKVIFGTLYLAGIGLTAASWWLARG